MIHTSVLLETVPPPLYCMLAHVRPRLTEEQIRTIADEACTGDAVQIPERATHWAAAQLRSYLESSGRIMPRDAVLFPEATGVAEPSPAPALAPAPGNVEELTEVLSSVGLGHLSDKLASAHLDDLAQLVLDDRPAMLKWLKDRGVGVLGERQKCANSIQKVARERGLSPKPKPRGPPGPVPFEPGRRGITIAGKTDAFGAQLQAQLSGVAFAHQRGLQYVHTPMGRGNQMDHALHGVVDEDSHDFDHFGGMGSWCERAGPRLVLPAPSLPHLAAVSSAICRNVCCGSR